MTRNIHNNTQVLQQLEWDIIQKSLKESCFFEQSFKNILKLKQSRDEVSATLQNSTQFHLHLENDDFHDFILTYRTILDPGALFTDAIQRIRKSAAVRFSDLNELALIIELFLEHHKLINNLGYSQLSTENANSFKQKVQKSFLVQFRHFVDKDGSVDFFKHPLLKNLYKKQLELERQIRETLSYLCSSPDIQKILQFTSWDLINDHYVIPIKSDSYNSKIGKVISRSDSGHTLFVEPRNITTKNYERLEVVIEISKIVSQIELELAMSLHPFLFELDIINDFYYQIDELYGRYLLATKFQLVSPKLLEEKKLIMKEAFHPLIKKPIKNDLIIEEECSGLIISGPNTGGKTATLKTLALTQVFLRYGLFVPAGEAELFLYDKVFYFGNDQQNLSEGLSSFSAEVKNYTEIMSALGSTNLILIDEIFNSTSSEEASALAIALFNKIGEISDSHIIVSSHHQTLKTFIHQNDSFKSCHVGFNLETNRPTYKINYGSPGSSHALRIFENITSSNEHLSNLCSDAEKFLDHKMLHYEKLLDSIAKKEHELDGLISNNSQLEKELKNQKSAMDGVLKLKLAEQVRIASDKISKIMQKADALIHSVKKGDITNSKKIYQNIKTLSSQIDSISPKQETVKKDYSNLSIPSSIVVGKKYFSIFLGKTVTIKQLSKRRKEALVQAGNLSIKCPIDSLRNANMKGDVLSESRTSYIPAHSAQMEYDCRGMRLEEFQDTIEKAVADLLIGDIPHLNFIHGHGTGVLKKWLRKYIKLQKNLSIDDNQTGNDGETKIKLI